VSILAQPLTDMTTLHDSPSSREKGYADVKVGLVSARMSSRCSTNLMILTDYCRNTGRREGDSRVIFDCYLTLYDPTSTRQFHQSTPPSA
jgi:hypothetical protein